MVQKSKSGTQTPNRAGDRGGQAETGNACPLSSEVGGSAPLSNTAPSNCRDSLSGTTILRTGIDSIYVSCPGQITEEAEKQLRTLKELAQSDDPKIRAGAFLELAGHRFEVRDKGKGRYPFVLVDHWFHIQIAARSAKQLPMAYCQVRSEALTCQGFKPVMLDLVMVLLQLDADGGALNVSRLDLCADFVTDENMGEISEVSWVCRAKQLNRYSENGQFSGYQFGAGGEMSARLYDKTREIEKSRKFFFHNVWEETQWLPGQTVWRLEFQYKREVLRELKVETVGQLVDNLSGLWGYASGQWLQLKIPSNDQTCTRWPVRPLWRVLQAAEWEGIHRELWRVRTSREPDDHYLYINGLGVLSSFMAKENLDDPEVAMQRYLKEARRFHARRTKAGPEAMDRYLLEKARLKATKFNKPLPGVEKGEGEDAF